MKNLLFICIVAVSLCTGGTLHAQAFSEGGNYISAGYGFATFTYPIIHTFADKAGFTHSTTGPLYLKYEHAVSNTIGLGLNLAYADYSIGYSDRANAGSSLY